MKKETEEKVFTHWTVKELLGQGSFGKVYRIEREEFGTLYQAAMKKIVIPQTEAEVEDAISEGMDEQSVTRYFKSFVEEIVNEFKLMAQLKGHTNIVSYEDHLVIPHEDGIGWDILIRMELLKSLKTLTAERNLTEEEVIKLGIDICNALEVCGKMNIIHRDIKPENIFISSFGEFKLGDFGIARTAEKTMSNLSKKGTYTYMAPEVYKGEAYDATVDIYSLGIVMYRFMNYNRAPFLPAYPQPISFSDREASMTRRISEEPMPAPACGSKELKQIILKACAYQVSARYQTPAQLRSDLERLLQTTESLREKEEATVAEISSIMPSVMPSATQNEALEETVTVSIFDAQKEPERQELKSASAVRSEPKAKKSEKKKKTGLFIAVGIVGILAAIVIGVVFVMSRGSHTASSNEFTGFSYLDGAEKEGTDALETNTAEISASELMEIIPQSEEYLYGHYNIGEFDGNIEKSFFEGMETMTVGGEEVALIPCEIYCFPEGTLYRTEALRDLIDEIGGDATPLSPVYASQVYMDELWMTKEEVFEEIVYTLFGYEVTTDIYAFYEENIKGQGDTAELIYIDKSLKKKSLVGYYKVKDSVMDFSYLDLDESGQLVLRPLQYDIVFSGSNLIVSQDGITRKLRPQGSLSKYGYNIDGYASETAELDLGISRIWLGITGAEESEFNTDLDESIECNGAVVYFADGWRTEYTTATVGPDNKIEIQWKQQGNIEDAYARKEEGGSLTAHYLDCDKLGFILRINDKDYFYQKTGTEYYADLVGRSVIDAELSDETLEEMRAIEREMLLAIQTAMQERLETMGYIMDEIISVDEKTCRISINNSALFDFNGSALSREGMDILFAMCDVMETVFTDKEYYDYMDAIIVEGHTDSGGDYKESQRLSEAMAEAVDDYCYEWYSELSSYMETIGCSSDEPVYDEDGNVDSYASERVVLWITLDADTFIE